MEILEKYKNEGYSYYIGYSYTFKGYLCRIWKDLEKPVKVRCCGGGDITLFTESYSGLGPDIEQAIKNAVERSVRGLKPYWYEGLPIQPRH